MDYIFSKSTDFNNNLELSTLHKNILNSEINSILSGINLEEDVVTIRFQDQLTPEEIQSLNDVISSHVPIPVDNSFIYDAIVDKDDTGDFKTLNEAVASGAITILIRSGIYVETSDILLPDNFYICGEDKTNTILLFNQTSSGLILDGGNNIESSGTISITHNTNSIIGIGTSFTNLFENDYIKIGRTFHQIKNIQNDNLLTLKNMYNGPTLTDIDYKATTLKTGTLNNISLGLSSSSLLTIKKSINVSINNVGFGMSSNGIFIEDSAQILLGISVVYNCGNAINVNNSDQVNLTQSVIKNNSINGVFLSNCSNIVMDGLNITNSGSNGIHISGGDNIQVMDTTSNYNHGNGLESSTGNVVIQSCIFSYNNNNGIITNLGVHSIGGCTLNNNNNNGIELSNNDCMIHGCSISNNLIGIQFNTSNNCSITGSLISNNTTKGLQLNTSNENIINSCQIRNNQFGIEILSSSTDNIISSSVVRSNTVQQIVDNGTDTTIVNNKIN